MNGATADPWLKIISPPKIIKTIIMEAANIFSYT